MKISPSLKIVVAVMFSTAILVIYSCKKNTVSKTSGNEEYIHYTVNGTPYAYDNPVDSVYTLDSLETLGFINGIGILAIRIPANAGDFVKINFNNAGIALGSQQTMNIFHISPPAVDYAYNVPSYATAASPVTIQITEYGLVGEYISGNFSCLLTTPAPANTPYNITCNFRIKRKL
jgi:hypothetical protein